ncbi:MAG TPA: MBL fold metallo-hydrolase [Thermoanaerobaculia bacterium]|nr:MBL fold metallo-hydrolase [Thermoanaerobaculia bacterium]
MFRISHHGPITRLRMARTLFGRPGYEVSAYAYGGFLIDSGPPTSAGQLVDWCREHPEIRRVVLTHHHEDHVGGAAALQEKLKLPVHAPAPAVPILAEGLRMPLYRRAIWTTPRRFRAEPLGDWIEGEGCRLRVIPTPGHAMTHVCLFDEERRWLFSGDLYVHEKVRYLRRIENAPEHIASLRRVLALEPQLLICDHAGILEHAPERLARKIRFWEELAGKARELRDQGLSTGEIAHRLLGRDGFISWASLGDFSHRNLIESLLTSPEA